MTLRLDQELDAALTERARREGRSKQEVAREAIRVYVEHYSKRELLDLVLDTELPRYADALERLGQ
jgi:predicted transcriptional regulator